MGRRSNIRDNIAAGVQSGGGGGGSGSRTRPSRSTRSAARSSSGSSPLTTTTTTTKTTTQRQPPTTQSNNNNNTNNAKSTNHGKSSTNLKSNLKSKSLPCADECDPSNPDNLRRSLGRNDVELAALGKLHGQLRNLRGAIVEEYGEDVLIEIVLKSKESGKKDGKGRKGGEDSKDVDDINQDGTENDNDDPSNENLNNSANESPSDKRLRQLSTSFLLRIRLRRRLLNRLARRLHRVAHIMDIVDSMGSTEKGSDSKASKAVQGMKAVTAPMPPGYGDRIWRFVEDAVDEGVAGSAATMGESSGEGGKDAKAMCEVSELQYMEFEEKEAKKKDLRLKLEEQRKMREAEQAEQESLEDEHEEMEETDGIGAGGEAEVKREHENHERVDIKTEPVTATSTAEASSSEAHHEVNAMDVDSDDNRQTKHESMMDADHDCQEEGFADADDIVPDAAPSSNNSPDAQTSNITSVSQFPATEPATKPTVKSKPYSKTEVDFLIRGDEEDLPMTNELMEYDVGYDKLYTTTVTMRSSNAGGYDAPTTKDVKFTMTITKTTDEHEVNEEGQFVTSTQDASLHDKRDRRVTFPFGIVKERSNPKDCVAEWNRWTKELCDKIPDQVTFEDLGVGGEGVVFDLEGRLERAKELKRKREEERIAEEKRVKDSGEGADEGDDGEVSEESDSGTEINVDAAANRGRGKELRRVSAAHNGDDSSDEEEDKDELSESDAESVDNVEEDDSSAEEEDENAEAETKGEAKNLDGEVDDPKDETKAGDDSLQKEAENTNEEIVEEIPPKRSSKLFSLIPVPSFYYQDIRRVKLIQGELVHHSNQTHLKKVGIVAQAAYNAAFEKSSKLNNELTRAKHELAQAVESHRKYCDKLRENSKKQMVEAQQRWKRRQEELQRRRRLYGDSGAAARRECETVLRGLVDRVVVQSAPLTESTKGSSGERTGDSTKMAVESMLAHMVDCVDKRAMDKRADNPTFEPPIVFTEKTIIANKETGETMAQVHEKSEQALKEKFMEISAAFKKAEENRNLRWRALQNAKAALSMPPDVASTSRAASSSRSASRTGGGGGGGGGGAGSSKAVTSTATASAAATSSARQTQQSHSARETAASVVIPAPVQAPVHVPSASNDVPAATNPSLQVSASSDFAVVKNEPDVNTDASQKRAVSSSAKPRSRSKTKSEPSNAAAIAAIAVVKCEVPASAAATGAAAAVPSAAASPAPAKIPGGSLAKYGYGDRYSIDNVKARKLADGTVKTVSAPKKLESGLYKRPAGRQRKGMDWDAVRGVWVPVGTVGMPETADAEEE